MILMESDLPLKDEGFGGSSFFVHVGFIQHRKSEFSIFVYLIRFYILALIRILPYEKTVHGKVFRYTRV